MTQEVGFVDDQPPDREKIDDFQPEGGSRTVKALYTTDGKKWVAEHATRVFSNTVISQDLIDTNDDSSQGTLSFSVQRQGGGRGGTARKEVLLVKVELAGEEESETIDDELLLSAVFKAASWVPPVAAGIVRMEQVNQADEETIAGSIVVKHSKTYTVRVTKDGEEYTEIMNFAVVCMLNMYESHQNNNNLTAPTMPIYELLVEYHVGGGGRGIKAVNNSSELINENVSQYAKVRMPVFVMGSDLSQIKTLIERFTSTYSSFVPIKLTTDQFRAILAKKQADYVANGGRHMRIVESFGLQKSYFECKLFVFSNGAVRADTKQIVPLSDVGYKLVPSILYSQSSLSEAFYPVIVPCESDVLRLRFLRTLHYVIKRFTRSNLQVAMNVFAMYICASSFNDIQHAMSGVPITSIVSEEGSTGKTELLKLLGALLGMHPKGMCAFATEAGLYELFKVLRSMIIVLDDVQYDPKEGRARGVDEVTIKALYDALQRVVMGKMLEATSAVVMTLNGDFMPKNQPVQSRQLRFKYRKNQNFDPNVLRMWRDMMAAAPIMTVDMTTWPFNPTCLNDCIEFMSGVMLQPNHSVGVRSAQNCGPCLYRRIQLGTLLLYDQSEWDAMFTDFAVECNRTAVEFSANAGIVARFIDAFQQMRRVSNPLDNKGDSLHVHNVRTDFSFQGEEYYLIQLEEVVRVMCKQLQMRKEELQIKSLKLALEDMSADGVFKRMSNFYNNMLGFPALSPVEDAGAADLGAGGAPTPPREPLTEGELNDENTVPRMAFAIPKRILDRAPESAVNVDFKRIMIRGVNFYESVVSGRWRGIREILESPLGKAMVDYDLRERDDWSDPELAEKQVEFVRNMARKLRPTGKVPFFDCGRPDGWVAPDWDEDFYFGHEYKPLFNQTHMGQYIVIHNDGTLVINGVQTAVNWCRAEVYEVPMPGCRINEVDETVYGNVVLEDGTVIQNPPPLCYVDEIEEAKLIDKHLADIAEQRQRRMRDEDQDDPNGADHNNGGDDDEDDDDDFGGGGLGRGSDDDRTFGGGSRGQFANGGRPSDDEEDDDDDEPDPVYVAFTEWVEDTIIKGREFPPEQCPACTQCYAAPVSDIVCNSCMRTCIQRFQKTEEFRHARGDDVRQLVGEQFAIDHDADERARVQGARGAHYDADAPLLGSDDEEDDEPDGAQPRSAFLDDMADEDDEDEPIGITARKRKLAQGGRPTKRTTLFDYSDDDEEEEEDGEEEEEEHE